MSKKFVLPLLAALALLGPQVAKADIRVCGILGVRVQERFTIVRAPNECPRGFSILVELPDIYGDGSNGALTINNDRLLDGIGREYQSITIERGARLRLRSGSILRCSGTFINHGTIEILPGAYGSSRLLSTDSPLAPGGRQAHPGGVAVAAASDGVISYSTLARSGPGLPDRAPGSSIITRLPAFGGGGGGSGMTLTAGQESVGGKGGGSAQIYCANSITNRGTITAVGTDGDSYGGGGGAGGLLVLATLGPVVNTGTISVAGGNGADATFVSDGSVAVAAGGGGAGGHLQVVGSNFVNDEDGVFVTGGVAGSSTASAAGASIRVGGGQGGSLFADGGNGGSVAADAFEAAENGADGDVQFLNGNPLDIPLGY